MDYKWLECIFRTFDNHFIAFDKTKNVYTPICVVLHFFGEPMTAGFDKFTIVKPGTFFDPAITFGHNDNMIDQILTCPFCGAVPLDVLLAMFDIDGTRVSHPFQAGPNPII